jgi:hypothetical protein|tara:strand:+ start:5149 stop:5472 length:324 start_codon:yes stop_codon:yes gene_type:complete
MTMNTASQAEIASVCERGVDSYIKGMNKTAISNRINEGAMGAVFASALYVVFTGLSNLDYRMVIAPFVAGAAYATVGRRQAVNKDSEHRMSFEQVCSNLREDTEDAD